ncbi:hypothetical protein BH11BAC3_BH11BAC3_31400 [soil metagenome]
MKKILMLLIIFLFLNCTSSYSQKKYGYAVVEFRCSKNDADRNKVYYSPVIELNGLNFKKYTEGMDTSIPVYSVRYYNYAILKWFEALLKDKYNITLNDPEKYERQSTAVVYNKSTDCNDSKTDRACFYTDKLQLIAIRNNAINQNKLPANSNNFCEVIVL